MGDKVIRAVIAHIIRDGKILLIEKKQGHGKGKWNGPGGKIEPGESPEDAMVREVKEEVGIDVKSYRLIGHIDFYSVNEEDWEVFVYRVEDFGGQPVETEEARPQWIDLSKIPYGEMWEDDRKWLPLVISGRPFEAKFWFEGERMVKKEIRLLDDSGRGPSGEDRP